MKIYLGIFLTIIVLVAGIFLGYKLFAGHPNTPVVNSQTIVSALQEEGFLVTENYVFNQQVTIKNDTGSVIKDFFWGQDIAAFANMKVSSGVDLRQITFADVALKSNAVTIALPPIQDQSVEVVGDITLKNNQGILKRVFDNDDGYNKAYSALKEAAATAAHAADLRMAAQQSAQKQVEKIVKLLLPTFTVNVVFKT